MENKVIKAIQERRSTFQFKSQSLEEEKLMQILNAGRWAPSYLNKQPWEFIVVEDAEAKRELSKIGVRVSLFSKGIQNASVVIVVVVDPTKDPLHYIEAGSVASQNIVLAAHSLGFASFWLGIFNYRQEKHSAEEEVKKLLNIPKELRVLTLLPIGIPVSKEQSTRKKLVELVHRNHYTSRDSRTPKQQGEVRVNDLNKRNIKDGSFSGKSDHETDRLLIEM